MKSNVYVAYCLVVTMALVGLYGEVKEYLASPEPYLREIKKLTEVNESERLRHLMTAYEFEDFRQHVATLLPGVIKEKGPGEKSYPLRNVASLTQKGQSDSLMNLRAKDVFEEGRSLFRSGRYPEAAQKFQDLISKYTYSAQILEAMFLTLECHYQMREFDQVVKTMEKMVDAFPESELTGYAMLRVGKVYEMQDRYDDANRIYKTVLASFPDRGLASAAREMLE